MTHRVFTGEEIGQRTTTLTPYHEILRHPDMSLGVLHLAAGEADTQHPHSADELYIVQRGQAQLTINGATIHVSPGTVVSIPRGTQHHFINITEDLLALVVFAPPSVPE